MKLRASFLVLACFSAFCTRPAGAQSPNVTVQLGGQAGAAANALGISRAELEARVAEQIGALYSVNDVQEFLKLSANAQSLLNKGVGVDYASNPTGFLLGVAVSGALDTGQSDVRDVTVDFDPSQRAVPVGVGAQISLMVGYNFAKQGIPGLTVYANGLVFPLGIDEFEADFYNFGLHAQYSLIGATAAKKPLRWGGLKLTTGLEFSEMVLNLRPSDQIQTRTPLSTGAGTIFLNTSSTGDLELVQTAWTVPLEASTSVDLFYFLSLYAGVGLDFQFGGASIRASLRDDNLTADIDGDEIDLGSAEISADDENGPTTVLFRVMTGLQVNVGPLKVFGQVNLQPDNLPDGLTISAVGGVRGVF